MKAFNLKFGKYVKKTSANNKFDEYTGAESEENEEENRFAEEKKRRLLLSRSVFSIKSSLMEPLSKKSKSLSNKNLELFVRGRISRKEYMTQFCKTHPQKDVIQLNVKLLRLLAVLSSENENQFLFDENPSQDFKADFPQRDQLQARMFLEAYKYGIEMVDPDAGNCLYEGVKNCLKNIIHVLILYKKRRHDSENLQDIIKPFTSTYEGVLKTKSEDESQSGRNIEMNDLNACKKIVPSLINFGSFFDKKPDDMEHDESVDNIDESKMEGKSLKRKRDGDDLSDKLPERMLKLTDQGKEKL